jgi:hypothetical protein
LQVAELESKQAELEAKLSSLVAVSTAVPDVQPTTTAATADAADTVAPPADNPPHVQEETVQEQPGTSNSSSHLSVGLKVWYGT